MFLTLQSCKYVYSSRYTTIRNKSAVKSVSVHFEESSKGIDCLFYKYPEEWL